MTDFGFALHFIKLRVRDLVRMTAFYREGFGLGILDQLTVAEFDEKVLALPGEKAAIILIQYLDGREPTEGGPHATVGFDTRDIEAAHAHLLACGGEAVGGIEDVGFARACFMRDPEGNQLELLEMKAS
ncbi:MAG: VOC family protein [Sphingomonadaceae bacterium]|nr:VOC family protein [Sphingomonadaceae bacterium]